MIKLKKDNASVLLLRLEGHLTLFKGLFVNDNIFDPD